MSDEYTLMSLHHHRTAELERKANRSLVGDVSEPAAGAGLVHMIGRGCVRLGQQLLKYGHDESSPLQVKQAR